MDDNKDSKVEKEDQSKEDVQKEASKDKNPFGENVKPAMYILFDMKKGNFFVLGAPGFLDDPMQAYGALKIAEKNLDEFYKEKKSFKDKFTTGVRNFNNKMNMRRFLNER